MFCLNIAFYKRREDVFQRVKYDPNNFKYFREFQNDFEITKEAVSKNGNLLQYASQDLKDNVEIVKTAFSNNQFSLFHASERIQKFPSLLK